MNGITRGVARGGAFRGSSTPFVDRTNTTIDGIDKQQNRKHVRIIIKLHACIYIYIYIYIAKN